MEQLPNELWKKIAGFCGPAGRLRLGQTCRGLALICFADFPNRYSLIWGEIRLTVNVFTPSTLALSTAEFGAVGRINVNGHFRMEQQFLLLYGLNGFSQWVAQTPSVRAEVCKLFRGMSLVSIIQFSRFVHHDPAFIAIISTRTAIQDLFVLGGIPLPALLDGYGFSIRQALEAFKDLPYRRDQRVKLGILLWNNASLGDVQMFVENFEVNPENIKTLFSRVQLRADVSHLVPLLSCFQPDDGWGEFIRRRQRHLFSNHVGRCIFYVAVAKFQPSASALWELWFTLHEAWVMHWYGIWDDDKPPSEPQWADENLIGDFETNWFYALILRAEGENFPPRELYRRSIEEQSWVKARMYLKCITNRFPDRSACALFAAERPSGLSDEQSECLDTVEISVIENRPLEFED